MRTSPQEYTASAKLMHWLGAILIFVVFPLGLIMEELPRGALKGLVIDTHEAIGVAVFLVAALRLVRRGISGSPAPVAGTPLERLAAGVVHVGAYLLLLAIPLVGWAMVSAGGHTVDLGLFSLPSLVAPNEELKEVLGEVHEVLAWGLLGLVAVHVAAALKHHWFDHDQTLVRMLPNRRAAS